MKEILDELNALPGIRGSMVMTQDGIMAASSLEEDLEEDVVAALSSALLTAVKKALRRVGADQSLRSFVLTGSDGKLVFLDLENAYLVVVTKRDLELDSTMVEIQSAARRIQNRPTHLAALAPGATSEH